MIKEFEEYNKLTDEQKSYLTDFEIFKAIEENEKFGTKKLTQDDKENLYYMSKAAWLKYEAKSLIDVVDTITYAVVTKNIDVDELYELYEDSIYSLMDYIDDDFEYYPLSEKNDYIDLEFDSATGWTNVCWCYFNGEDNVFELNGDFFDDILNSKATTLEELFNELNEKPYARQESYEYITGNNSDDIVRDCNNAEFINPTIDMLKDRIKTINKMIEQERESEAEQEPDNELE